MINKFFVIFIAIVFICCVFAYGSSERFSFEKWIDNVTSIADMTSIQDVVDCWTKSYYTKSAFEALPYTVEWYTIQDAEGGGMEFVYRGTYPLAYEIDGRYTKKFDYEFCIVYNADGTWNKNSNDSDGAYPIVTNPIELVMFESYHGENDVLQWLDTLVGFFKRLWRTVVLLVQILIDAFKNLDLLLPWNATVPI